MSQFKVGDLVIIKEAFEAPYALSKDTVYCVWNLTGMGSIGLVGKSGSYGEEYFELFEQSVNQSSSKSINIKEEKKSALDVQEGGGHYKSKGIQPVEYAYRNNLGFIESNVVKYVSRWKEKNGIQDLKKARHYLDILIEFEEQKEQQ